MKKKCILILLLTILNHKSFGQIELNCIEKYNIYNEFREFLSEFTCVESPHEVRNFAGQNTIPFSLNNEKHKEWIKKYLCITDSCFSIYIYYEPYFLLPIYNNFILIVYGWEDDYSEYAILASYDYNGNRKDVLKISGGKRYNTKNPGELDFEDISTNISNDYKIKITKLNGFKGETINDIYVFNGSFENYEYEIDTAGKFILNNHTTSEIMKFDSEHINPQKKFPIYLPVNDSTYTKYLK